MDCLYIDISSGLQQQQQQTKIVDGSGFEYTQLYNGQYVVRCSYTSYGLYFHIILAR